MTQPAPPALPVTVSPHPEIAREVVLADGRTVIVRRAREEDAAGLLAYLGYVGGESPYLTFGAEGLGVDEEEIRRHAVKSRLRDNALFLVAELDGDIVGALTFECGERERIRHIGEFGVSVARACQGSGVGRTLVQSLIDWAEASGTVRKINLRVRVDNQRAISLYEKLGFAIEGRISRDLLESGRFFESYWMGRPIDPPA